MTTDKKNYRSLPRKKRTPSLRDQAIFLAYRTQGRSQEELAKDNRLSQRRISAILRRVAHYSANLAPSVIPTSENRKLKTENLSAPELRRLEWLLCRERSQSLFNRSLRAFDREKSELKTLREGHRDNKPFQETVTREVNTSAQLLRVAQRANSDLLKLALTEPPPQPQPEADERLLERLMFERLYQDRQQAEDENKVATSTTDLEYFQVVDRWYAALIGDQDYLPIHPADLEPTEPLGQLAQFFHQPSWNTCDGAAPRDYPPDATESLAASTPHSVPGTQYPSSPPQYTPDPHEPCDPASNYSNCSNPSSPNSTPTPSSTTTSTPSPTFDNRPSTFDPAPSPKTSSPNPEPRVPKPLSPAARRLAHERKLEQFKEFRRRGLPCMFEFDPEDGPLPPPHHPGDHYITTPGIF